MNPTDQSLYLAFRLGSEVYAIDILSIREIVEYSEPSNVPLMPPTVRGVINLRGTVVPLIDLSVRFGRAPTLVGKRTCFVIVEIEYAGAPYVLGLMVDGVNGVTNIPASEIEPPPAFGMKVDQDFIAGIGRSDGRFVIILEMGNVLAIDEMATIGAELAAPEQTTQRLPA